MTWFRPYRLWLGEDKRTGILYKKFIGRVSKNQSFYIRTVELWDEFAKCYRKESVLLRKVCENHKLQVIAVQVEDAIL
jgi:hypothetical protein